METGECNMKQNTNIKYVYFHWNLLIASLILLSVGIYSFSTANKGLIFYFYALPSAIWSGLFPAIFGAIFLIAFLARIKRIQITSNSEKDNEIQVIVKRSGPNMMFSSNPNNLITYGVITRETKLLRWATFLALLQLVSGMHYTIGSKLLGFSFMGPILLYSGAGVFLAAIIFIAFPRKVLFLKSRSNQIAVDLPQIFGKITNNPVNIVAISSSSNSNRVHLIERNTKEKLLLASAVVLLSWGIVLFALPELYFGEFSSAICMALGTKLLVRRYYGLASVSKQNKRRSVDRFASFDKDVFLVLKYPKNDQMDPFPLFSYKRNFLELLCWWYMAAQSVKYIFRNLWVEGIGVDWLYLIAGFLIILIGSFVLTTPKTKNPFGSALDSLVISSVNSSDNRIYPIANAKSNVWFWVGILGFIVALILPFILYPLKLYWILA